MSTTEPPFLRLPCEIRLLIYSYLLLPRASTSASTSANSIAPDHHDYEQQSSLTSPPDDSLTLHIRTLDPTKYDLTARPTRLRTTYAIRHDRFRARVMHTTYCLSSNPGIYTAILCCSRQTHAEAAEVLYGAATFSFSTHVEAIVPFMSDLTPFARSKVRRIALTKRALPYCKEFDRLEWAAACRYLAKLPLTFLELGVVAGKPGPDGWADPAIPTLEVGQFGVLERYGGSVGEGGGGVDMEWCRQLMAIKGLKECRVKAIVEHCPPPVSDMMAFWVAFSKSVEGAFGEWVRGIMCAAA